MNLRIGNGYDIHRLTENRNLILGGVNIPYEKGLLGHSDADVLIHSIIDALLGASDLPNIGVLFPDNDEKYKDISSSILLEKVKLLLKEKNISIVNIDSVIVAQRPKLNPFISEMRKNISDILEISPSLVGIKPKTAEHLGEIGNGNAIEVYSVCLVELK